jgi:hypothetical protein
MDDDRLRHLRRLRAAHQKQLDELELQAVTFGKHVPAQVAVQVEDEKHAIELLDAEILGLHTPDDVQEAIGPDAQFKVLSQRIKQQADRQNDGMLWTQTQIREMRTEVTRLLAAVRAENAEQSKQIAGIRTQQQYAAGRVESQGGKIDTLIEQRIVDEQKRKRGQTRNLLLIATNLILLVLFITGLVWLLSSTGVLGR